MTHPLPEFKFQFNAIQCFPFSHINAFTRPHFSPLYFCTVLTGCCSALQFPSALFALFLRHLRAVWQMGGDGKVFTLAEVSQHNTRKDCWLIINGKVYNVTEFLEDHPGGDEVLLSGTGKDATDDFEDVGHSESAREMMNKYYVGEIDISTIPERFTYTAPKQPHYNQDKTTKFIVKLLQFLVPLAILSLAVGIRFYSIST